MMRRSARLAASAALTTSPQKSDLKASVMNEKNNTKKGKQLNVRVALPTASSAFETSDL